MQLYNLKDDIGETNNLVAKYPEKVVALVALLKTCVADGRSTPGAVQKNDAKIDIWKMQLEPACGKEKESPQEAWQGEASIVTSGSHG